MDEAEEGFLKQLQDEAATLQDKNHQLNSALSSSAFQGQDNANLIQLQIDTAAMIGKIEHFLRGEFIATDEEGNEFWSRPTKPVLDKNGKPKEDKEGNPITEINHDLILLNDYGVNMILSILGNYLDKNTLLSYYEEERINEILADLGDKLAEELFNTYERVGLDTEYKKTRYPLIVLTILHTVESAYRRSLHGKTMEQLNTSNIVTQTDNMNLNPQRNINPNTQKKSFSPFRPSTW